MVRPPRAFIAAGRSFPLLCLSHPGTQGIRFRDPGRPITGVTSTRTPLVLPIGLLSLAGCARGEYSL